MVTDQEDELVPTLPTAKWPQLPHSFVRQLSSKQRRCSLPVDGTRSHRESPSESNAFTGRRARRYRWEMSHHRTRPPTSGIARRTRLIVVDNSQIGKEAHEAGKLGYCIWTYNRGYRKGHMPPATLGDKVSELWAGEEDLLDLLHSPCLLVDPHRHPRPNAQG